MEQLRYDFYLFCWLEEHGLKRYSGFFLNAFIISQMDVLQIHIICVPRYSFSGYFLFAMMDIYFLRGAAVHQGTSKGEIAEY